ncbi:MAG: membrane protein insertase YidC [Thermodesulfobacteriota bacterium]
MEKRAILAIILTFLIILGWGFIQSKISPPPKEVGKEEELKYSEKREVKPILEERRKPEPLPIRSKKFVKKDITVETQNYWATLTNEDARVRNFKLKKYEDRVKESQITIKLIKFIKEIFGGKLEDLKNPVPLDLVNTNESEGLPLGLIIDSYPQDLVWEIESDNISLLNKNGGREVIFSNILNNGLRLLKKYRFYSDRYELDLEVEVQNPTSQDQNLKLGLEWIGRVELEKLANEGNKDYGLRYTFLKNKKIEKKELGGATSSGCTPSCGSMKRKIDPFEFSEKGDIEWFAFEGEYFVAIITKPSSEKEVILNVKGVENNILKANFNSPSISIPAKSSVLLPYRIYLGPKNIKALKEFGRDVERLVDFGFFAIVAKPILWFLKLTHSVTKNFGFDIIILSILIKIIFLPLTQISMKSMKEMQKVQPEMNRLRQQFKNDKARLQQEIMLLYKRRRINPMSGCLPMLIQVPVFIALYNALQKSIEMRHAPFILWVRDLSAKDPIYITPLIMGATMVIQQKMTPTSADPAQAKIFMLMPIMFTFLFLNFPSGLVLYWLVNNVLSIAHQYYMNRKG